jgi:hypothetical protein
MALAFSLLFVSCSDDNTEFKTRETPRAELYQTPGFSWFEAKVMTYKADSLIAKDIKSNFQSGKQTLIFFAAPACSCDSNQNVFPHSMAVLDASGIASTNYKIVAMQDENAANPYSEIIKVKKLPEIYLLENGTPKYSIGDTFRVYFKTKTIDKIMLDAIKSTK